MITKSPFMEIALEEAEKAAKRDEVPVGAVIVDTTSDKVIAACGNMVEALNDPTAHAEMLAIKQACAVKNTAKLVDCAIYVSLEPCPMCAQAISFARLRSLYFGAYDKKMGGVENGPCVLNSSSCHHRPEIYGGIYENESQKILRDFFSSKR